MGEKMENASAKNAKLCLLQGAVSSPSARVVRAPLNFNRFLPSLPKYQLSFNP